MHNVSVSLADVSHLSRLLCRSFVADAARSFGVSHSRVPSIPFSISGGRYETAVLAGAARTSLDAEKWHRVVGVGGRRLIEVLAVVVVMIVVVLVVVVASVRGLVVIVAIAVVVDAIVVVVVDLVVTVGAVAGVVESLVVVVGP